MGVISAQGMAGRRAALWTRRAVEKAGVLVQGQGELLALSLWGWGFFSSVLPSVSRAKLMNCFTSCSVMLFSFPSPADALKWSQVPPSGETLGGEHVQALGVCCPPRRVPQPSSNCRAVCVTPGM